MSVCFPDYIYDTEKAGCSYGSYAAVKEDGYYLVINYSLYFYDIQSDTLFPLCTKPSCLHKDDTCDAYIFSNRQNAAAEDIDFMTVNGWTANAVDYNVFYYRDSLYMIAENPSKGAVLFQYRPDFSERKEIVRLADDEADPRVKYTSVFFHHGYVYYMTYLHDDDESARAISEHRPNQTIYTAWRIKLEEKAEPEELFSLDCTESGNQLFRIGAFDNAVFFIIEYITGYYMIEEKAGSIEMHPQITGIYGKVYRYDEGRNQTELIWSHSGDQFLPVFGAEGAVPRNMYSTDYLINTEGDYVYFAGESKYGVMFSDIAAVNLKTREGKVLYETPYLGITQLRSDGRYYYFIEISKEQVFLTAIDSEGKLLRRYAIPYDESFEKKMDSHPEMSSADWLLGFIGLRLLVTDSRYITLCGYGENGFKNLSSTIYTYNAFKYDSSDIVQGIGLINTEDFLSGKDVEIRQIYERTDPFN